MNLLATELFNAMINVDRKGASIIMDRAFDEGINPKVFMTTVLDPALFLMGELWGKQEVSLAQTFVGAKIAEDVLTRCLALQKGENPRSVLGTVVIGNIEEDFHSLGRRMIVSFLQASSWNVVDLGNDVPAEVFIEKALEKGASVIGASAMMQTTALNIRKIRDLIDSRGLTHRLKLAVGGAVFNWRPELVAEVGGDGTASNAATVHELILQLQSSVKADAP